MKIHELKSYPEYFAARWSLMKTFEIRKNDRGYAVKDILREMEWNPNTEEYTGREISSRVTYCMTDPLFVKDGYAVMSCREIGRYAPKASV